MNNLLRRLRIADLELLITAMHLQNLSKAAALHNMSQSAASATIQRVEAAFGQALCHHEKRRFRLTHEGEVLIPRIEAWLQNFREKVTATIERPMRLATTQAMARAILPSILSVESLEIELTRPDKAYAALLKNEADIAIVPDNAPWKDVTAVEIGQGSFGLYSALPDAPLGPVLLPENQIEVLSFLKRWEKMYGHGIAIKARIPSWSLIADLCAGSTDVGFLPDFLARKMGLYPVAWQPEVSLFHILALYRPSGDAFQNRINTLIELFQDAFRPGQIKR